MGPLRQAAAMCSMPTSPACGWHLAGLEEQRVMLKSSVCSEGCGQLGDWPSAARELGQKAELSLYSHIELVLRP